MKEKYTIYNKNDLIKNINKCSPDDLLYYSSYYDYIDGVKLAIKNDANINYLCNCALTVSVFNNYTNIVIYLIENGADVRVFNDQLLITAIDKKYYDICDILINNGCELSNIEKLIDITNYLNYIRNKKLKKINERLY